MVLAILISAFMSVALFYLKYEVAELEDEFDTLNRAINMEREASHVLRAEWSHLNDISRIKLLADKYLEIRQTDPKQIKTIKNIPTIQVIDNPDQEVILKP